MHQIKCSFDYSGSNAPVISKQTQTWPSLKQSISYTNKKQF